MQENFGLATRYARKFPVLSKKKLIDVIIVPGIFFARKFLLTGVNEGKLKPFRKSFFI